MIVIITITSKTRGIPRMFQIFPNVYGWCSCVEGWAKIGERATHTLGKTVLHTCSDLFKPVQTFSHLFTPGHTSVTIYALCAIAVSCRISPLQKLLFFDLTSCLAEIAYFSSPNRELFNSVWLV